MVGENAGLRVGINVCIYTYICLYIPIQKYYTPPLILYKMLLDYPAVLMYQSPIADSGMRVTINSQNKHLQFLNSHIGEDKVIATRQKK